MNATFRGIMVAVFVVVTGWASSPAAIAQDRFRLAAQPQVYLVQQTARATFVLQGTTYRAASGVFGLVADFAQSSESAKLRQSLDLQDPVIHLKERLAELLNRELKLTNLRVEPNASDLPIFPGVRESLSDEARAANAPQPPTFRDTHPSGVVIELATRHWGIDNNKVKYFASVWVTDLTQSKRLYAGRCSPVIFDAIDKKKLAEADPKFDPYNLAEVENRLFADNGALLKAHFQRAAELCANSMFTIFVRTPRRGEKADAD